MHGLASCLQSEASSRAAAVDLAFTPLEPYFGPSLSIEELTPERVCQVV
jgi:hypothetical protein